jgi:hypothetical protein
MSEERPRPVDGETEAQMSDEELAAQLREELKRLRVADVAAEVMVTLVTLGYQKMGLTVETLDLRNLPDARLAIELLRGLIEAVEREKAGDVSAFRSTLAAMQLQYAGVASLPEGVLPGGETAPPGESPAEPSETEEDQPGAGGQASEPSEAGADASRPASRLWVPPGVRDDDEAR